MPSQRKDIENFRSLLEQGSIQRAYRAILSYMTGLRAHFERRLGDAAVSGLYQGHLDITYFPLFPDSLRRRDLKIGIVFNYEAFRFEAWLAARNREVQRRYWSIFKDSRWPKYRLRTPAKDVFSILECDLATDFDMDKPDELTHRIETAALAFIGEIERFLSALPPPPPRKPSASADRKRRPRG